VRLLIFILILRIKISLTALSDWGDNKNINKGSLGGAALP